MRADLGDIDDLRDLATTLRERGISLCIDLVLNHTAREHAWAEAARAGDAEKRDYYLVFPDRHLPDQYERSLPEVFPDFAPGNFTWDDELDGWVWTTFNDYQWDLNWANPDGAVRVRRHPARPGQPRGRGVPARRDRLPLEADGHHLPEPARGPRPHPGAAHGGPDRRPGRAVQGRGDRRAGRPAGLPRHRRPRRQGLRPRLPQQPDGAGLVDARLGRGRGWPPIALQSLPQPPSTTAWITYLRCHDDIGWAIDDTDAWRAGLDGFAHRRFLADWYAGAFPGSWARGLVFQENPATGDRRISGSLASLAGLEADDPGAVARILLAHAVVLGFGGLPGALDGRRARPAQRPRAGPTTPPTPPTTAGCTGRGCPGRCRPTPHGIREGLAHLLGVRAALPHLHAADADRDLGPARPRRPARRPPVARRPAAGRRQHDRPPRPGAQRGLPLARAWPPATCTTTSPADRPTFDGEAIALAPYAAAWLTAVLADGR